MCGFLHVHFWRNCNDYNTYSGQFIICVCTAVTNSVSADLICSQNVKIMVSTCYLCNLQLSKSSTSTPVRLILEFTHIFDCAMICVIVNVTLLCELICFYPPHHVIGKKSHKWGGGDDFLRQCISIDILLWGVQPSRNYCTCCVLSVSLGRRLVNVCFFGNKPKFPGKCHDCDVPLCL